MLTDVLCKVQYAEEKKERKRVMMESSSGNVITLAFRLIYGRPAEADSWREQNDLRQRAKVLPWTGRCIQWN